MIDVALLFFFGALRYQIPGRYYSGRAAACVARLAQVRGPPLPEVKQSDNLYGVRAAE